MQEAPHGNRCTTNQQSALSLVELLYCVPPLGFPAEALVSPEIICRVGGSVGGLSEPLQFVWPPTGSPTFWRTEKRWVNLLAKGGYSKATIHAPAELPTLQS